MPKVIGIDLGTTNSVVAVVEGGQPKVIINQEGDRLTPSVVGFKGTDTLVGKIAKRQAVSNPENTVYSIKRFMGRRYEETGDDVRRVLYKVIRGQQGDARVEAGGKVYSPPEISAFILKKLKEAAEAHLGEKVTDAVITVPAYFNDSQRQATKDAGVIAGLNVRRIINEPTASALAYGLEKKKSERIAVYDFGGGTFDISILEVGDDVIEVKSTSGDTHLGGDDLDQRIIDWLVEEFRQETGMDLTRDKMAMQRLKEASERAKIDLSTMLETEINLPFITADASGPKHLVRKLTRARFEQMVMDLFKKTLEPCKQAISDAKLTPRDIDEVVLVGGSTRIPKVQELVTDFFGKDPHQGINPDEVVAVGAAIQGAVLAGEVKDILLLDVTPLSLGIETLGNVFTKLIERNTTIPVRKSEIFTTATDNQTSVEIHVLQGERPMAIDNRTLARFILSDLPPAPRGIPQIEVTFDIDANGILNVAAKDLATNKEQKITVTSSSGLTKDEVSKMMKEAESHREDDRRKKEEAEAKNQLDSVIYSTEKILRENRDKISPQDASALETAVADAKKVYQEGKSKQDFERAMQDLTRASHKIAEEMYRQASAGRGAQAGGASGAGQESAQNGSGAKAAGDDVIDAEFKEEK